MRFFLLSILILTAIVIAGSFVFDKIYQFPHRIKYGVSFAPRYASYLKLDWQKTYLRLLDEAKIKHLRLSTYWDLLEPKSGEYDFSQTDFMLNEADKRDAKVILVVGMRQPRWPECQVPLWAKNLSILERRQKLLSFIGKTVERYKDQKSLAIWQVENEPLLPFFGEGCDRVDAEFLKTEVALVRSLSNKPIMVSDSGELGTWVVPMQLSDVFFMDTKLQRFTI